MQHLTVRVSDKQAVIVLDEDELDILATALHARMNDLRDRREAFEAAGVAHEAEYALQQH